jgi:hypothetical protein
LDTFGYAVIIGNFPNEISLNYDNYGCRCISEENLTFFEKFLLDLLEWLDEQGCEKIWERK